MAFVYENQGHLTYLSYKVLPGTEIDTMSLGMMTNNKIPGLVPSVFMQSNLDKYIKYDISAKISVNQLFSGVVSKKHLLSVFEGIINAVLSSEEYMIDLNSLLFDLDNIFVDVAKCEVSMICLPINNGEVKSIDLNTFFKNIIISINYDQSENCDYVTKIINYLNLSSVFSLEDFQKLLFSLEESSSVAKAVVENKTANVMPNATSNVVHKPSQPIPPAAPQSLSSAPNQEEDSKSKKKGSLFGRKNNENNVPPAPAANQNFAIPGQTPPVAPPPASQPNRAPAANQNFAIPGQTPPVASPPAPQPHRAPAANQNFAIPGQTPSVVPPHAPQSVPHINVNQVNTPNVQSMDFGETSVVGGDFSFETTVVDESENVSIKPHLIRIKNNEIINLDKDVFRIGREKTYADYCISDNRAISGSHAIILKRNDEVFVVDSNSRNHTFVNGEMINSNAEVKLEHGFKVRFANEEFEFKLYQ